MVNITNKVASSVEVHFIKRDTFTWLIKQLFKVDSLVFVTIECFIFEKKTLDINYTNT